MYYYDGSAESLNFENMYEINGVIMDKNNSANFMAET